MSLPVTEIMERGKRLAKLRAAGVPDPHLYIRSDREMDAALSERGGTEDTGRGVVASRVAERRPEAHSGERPTPPRSDNADPRLALEGCPWCGRPVPFGNVACPQHQDAEVALLEYR